ncbi:MAG: hypothetical protein AAB224_08425 [Gemmatimonadota bacterium]
MSPVGRLRALASDAGVRATAAARLVALAGAPVSLWLAATRLPAALQGYYFVGVNIVALAQLFELGLGTIIVQFASHEWPRLRWGASGGLEGDPAARDTVTAVLHTAVRWYGGAGLVLFAVAGIGGALLFRNPFAGAPLLFPVLWCGFTLVTALYLPLIPFICVAEGCGDLVSVQRMRGVQAAAALLSLWTGLIGGEPLIAVWLAAASQFVVAAVWLARRHPALVSAPRLLLADLTKRTAGWSARYRLEQGRSAQLWLALFLTYQSLAPILLYLRGGDESGRLGITLAVALAPLTLSLAWLHGRFPAFGTLIAEGKTAAFDQLARRATIEAAVVFVALAIMLTGGVLVLPMVAPVFAARFLPLPSLFALFAGSLGSLVLQAMAGWLRAFRDEKLAAPIVGGAAAVILTSAVAAAMGGAQLMTAVFAIASLGVAVPLAGAHFRRVRRQRLA